MNAGAAAEGGGAAEETSLAGRGKTHPAESKVSQNERRGAFVRRRDSLCCRSASCSLAVLERELRVQESLSDATRKRFLKHRQDQQSKQIQALDEEISRKVSGPGCPLKRVRLYVEKCKNPSSAGNAVFHSRHVRAYFMTQEVLKMFISNSQLV